VNFRETFLPIIPIELMVSERGTSSASLSGETYTIFHSDALKILNFKPLKRRQEFITAGIK
jgi:hypothetical protein